MMFSRYSNTGENQHLDMKRYFWLLISLLTILSLYDLLSQQFIAPTILRQTQTAMLTENFVKEGFKIKGLYLNIFGTQKPVMALEFPVYNSIVGLFFKVFGFNLFWGKLVSFLSSVISLVCICRLLKDAYNDRVAILGGLFFILSPLGMMLRTAFQPDSIALMFILLSLVALREWHYKRSVSSLFFFSISLLLGGLAKYPVIVPFMPLMSLAFFTRNDRLRFPGFTAIAMIALFFVLPFISWYLYRGQITDPCIEKFDLSMFLIGDLKRFFSLFYYINPTYSIVLLGCSGVGVLFFVFGLRNLSPVDKALLFGIPFYFIIIPTVKDQHYYLFACTPVFAFFMAKGWLALLEVCKNRQLMLTKNVLFILFVACFSFLSLYATVLRNDRVMVNSARTLNSLSKPDDLVFAVTMHNRTAIFGGINSTFFYFAKRKGWNVDLGLFKQLDQNILEKIKNQAEAKRKEGAKWMIITWYTSDLESPVDAYLPVSAKTRVDPGIDGSIVYDMLKREYETAFHGKNYAVLKL